MVENGINHQSGVQKKQDDLFVPLSAVLGIIGKLSLPEGQKNILHDEFAKGVGKKTGILLKPGELSTIEDTLGIEDQDTAGKTGQERIGRVVSAVFKLVDTEKDASKFLVKLEKVLDVDSKSATNTNAENRRGVIMDNLSLLIKQNGELTDRVKELEKDLASSVNPYEVIRAVLEGLSGTRFSDLSTQQQMDIVFKLNDLGIEINRAEM